MMNVKETLKRLHKRLPTLSLDELFELLDCYVEENSCNWYYKTPETTWTSDNKNIIKYYDNGTITTVKNHVDSADVQLNGHN